MCFSKLKASIQRCKTAIKELWVKYKTNSLYVLVTGIILVVGLLTFIANYENQHQPDCRLKNIPKSTTKSTQKPEVTYHTTVYVKWLDGNIQKLEVRNIKPLIGHDIYEIITENGDRLYFPANNVIVLERKVIK